MSGAAARARRGGPEICSEAQYCMFLTCSPRHRPLSPISRIEALYTHNKFPRSFSHTEGTSRVFAPVARRSTKLQTSCLPTASKPNSSGVPFQRKRRPLADKSTILHSNTDHPCCTPREHLKMALHGVGLVLRRKGRRRSSSSRRRTTKPSLSWRGCQRAHPRCCFGDSPWRSSLRRRESRPWRRPMCSSTATVRNNSSSCFLLEQYIWWTCSVSIGSVQCA